jgi:lysine-N-methylase
MNSSRGIELTLSFSCPAVLKLAEREQPLAIVKARQSPLAFPENNYAVEIFPQQHPVWKPLHYYFELETHFIDILQCRSLTLEERLAFLTDTIARVNNLRQDETFARELTTLFNRNYDLLDKLAAEIQLKAATKGIFLLENFLVSFIFRKPFYIYGFQKTLQLLNHIWRQVNSCSDVAAAIRQIEIKYGHDSQALWR